MTVANTRFSRIFFAGMFVVATMLLQSCLPEQKLARTFTQSRQMISLRVTPPELVYKFSHKGELIEDFDSLSATEKDSALYTNSKYIRYLSDSIVLENFMNNFIDELRQLGFNVYLDLPDDTFPASGPQSYLVNVSQLQFDEYIYPFEDQAEFFDSVYTKKINLEAMDISAWFDLRKSGSENAKSLVLYATNTVTSAFDGRFYADPFSGRIRYKYTMDELKMNELYEISSRLGKKYAGYLYDFFLNQYLVKNMPPGEELFDYYHFDRDRNMFTPTWDERFEVLNNQ
jgi:hypothetical protein